MDMLPAEDEDEESIVLLTESNEAQDEAQKPITGGVVSLMEIMKDAPAFSKNNIDEDQEELTVVPLMELMKDAMKLVCHIDNAYTSLDTKASEIAFAFSKIAPEHYATIDFMRYLLRLTDSLLDKLPQGRESSLVVLLEHFESCPSTEIVTNMTVHQGGIMEEEEQHETEGEIVSSSSANFEGKRGGKFPSVSEIRVNFLAVLANKINQQVYMMRVEKCKTINELQELVSAPIFNPTKSRILSQKLVTEFTGPVLQAVNAKLATLSNDHAPGSDEEEQGNDNNAPSRSNEEKQEGGESASKRPRIDMEHPQEEIIKITKQKQVSVVHVLPTNPFLQEASFCDALKKSNKQPHKQPLVEEVRIIFLINAENVFFLLINTIIIC